MAERSKIRMDMTMDTIMAEMPEVIPVLLKYKILCVGCLLTPFHDIMDAAREHGLDEEQLLNEMKRAVGEKDS